MLPITRVARIARIARVVRIANVSRCIVLLGMFVLLARPAFGQSRYVELEVVSSGGELGSQQEVMQMLSGVGADRVSVRTARNVVRPSVEESNAGELKTVRVVGVLDGSKIRFAGGKTFTLRDANGIRSFIQELRADGSTVTMAEKKAFGLTSEQLVAVYEDLSAEVTTATKGQPSNQVVERLVQGLQEEVTFSRAASAALDTTAVLEEYQGLSTGTALSGILRPLGLVLSPRREQGQDLQFFIATAEEVEEHWPVGWPIEEPPVEVAPELFEKLDDVSINNFALKDALDAIQGRVGVPFLYDQNSMARSSIDINQLQVTLVRKKMMYYTVVRKLVSQNKPSLSLEIRKDENDKPFLWIAPSQ